MEQATAGMTPPGELVKDALTNHCQQQQLNNEAALSNWLIDHCLSMEELLQKLSLPLKLNKLAVDNFRLQAEARFLQRKEGLDQVT